jgi:thiol-disulfide isomerase/thioredoxin
MPPRDPSKEPKHFSKRRHWLRVLACAPWMRPAAAANEAQYSSWSRNRATPPIELLSSDGSTWRLQSEKGRPLLLNFWASWCGPCREEMPSLQALEERYRSENLRVMAVNFREADAAVHQFVEGTSLVLPVLLDRDGTAAKAFDVHVFPSTVIVGRSGRVSSVVVGASDWMRSPAHDWVRAVL